MKFFSFIVHFVLAAGATGLAVGLNSVVPLDPVKAYTATGFAVGLGGTAFIRFLIILTEEMS